MYYHRAQLSKAIKREVAEILQRYIADPRLKNLTVTNVVFSKKLEFANISITQLDSRFTSIQTLEGLQRASSKIRYYLSKRRAQSRTVPKLRFHYDHLLIESLRISQLINQVTL